MKAKNVSFGGAMAALALLLLYLTSVAPSGRFALIAAASYSVGICVSVMGIKLSVAAYAAISVLAFVLLPDKSVAVLFAIFFGNYPIIKLLIEKIRRLCLEWIVKIVVFNIYAVIGWLALSQFTVLDTKMVLPLLWLVLNAVFVIYDIMFNIVVTKILGMKKGRNL